MQFLSQLIPNIVKEEIHRAQLCSNKAGAAYSQLRFCALFLSTLSLVEAGHALYLVPTCACPSYNLLSVLVCSAAALHLGLRARPKQQRTALGHVIM